MYLPIFRGRQYELLALDAEAQNNLFAKSFEEKQIIPIVDPVSLTTRLKKTIETFIAKEQYIGIIFNSTQPYLGFEISDLISFIEGIDGYTDYIVPVVNMTNNYEYTFNQLKKLNYTDNDCIIACLEQDQIENLSTFGHARQEMVKYILVGESRDFTRVVSRYVDNQVLCMDRFNKKQRNSDYELRPDEIFSSDHIYYDIDGFKGFSDYSIIGNDVNTMGFAPRAIAIHIVYKASGQDATLRVHHFVSETNDSIENPARKFSEALKKLIDWKKQYIDSTHALDEFQKLYDEGRYPGLGIIKKLSIQQHLETVYHYFQSR